MDVVELSAHQAAEDAATPMRRQHADHRDAGGADESPGDADLERKRSAAADDRAVVERGVHAVGRQERLEAVDELLGRSTPEVVADRRRGDRKLLRPDRADLDAQAIRSSGA